LAAVAQNPTMLGIGIDEDTAVLVEHPKLTVIGRGGVYVLDGSAVTFSTVADAEDYEHLSVHDLKVHLLAPGHLFDLSERRPSREPVATSGLHVVQPAGEERPRKAKRPPARTKKQRRIKDAKRRTSLPSK
jgi:cyanophycinase-like exopeptidase